VDIRESDGVVTLRVRVQPRSSRDQVGGVRDGALLVRLTAPPVEGAANAALARVLGRALSLPPSAVQLVHGSRGRDKLVRVEGTTATQVLALAGPLDAEAEEPRPPRKHGSRS
jgi:uncharacterized protein (TIGR00251 family)